jgi:hypothetical protein
MSRVSDEQRRKAALYIVKALSTQSSIIQKPLSKVNIKNIPDDVEPRIKDWIRRYRGAKEVYGSAAAATHAARPRPPSDLDIVVDNPKHAATALAGIFKRKGYTVRINVNPQWERYVVQIKKGNQWVDAIDVHPIKGFHTKYDLYGRSLPSEKIRGIPIQKVADQLLRKADALTRKRKDGTMGPPPRRELKDTVDFVQTAELLLESLEVRSAAEKKRAEQVRKALRVWKQHLKQLKGKAKIPKQISKTRAKKFVRRAVKTPSVDVDRLVFIDDDVLGVKKPTKVKKRGVKAVSKKPKAKKKKGLGKTVDDLTKYINKQF